MIFYKFFENFFEIIYIFEPRTRWPPYQALTWWISLPSEKNSTGAHENIAVLGNFFWKFFKIFLNIFEYFLKFVEYFLNIFLNFLCKFFEYFLWIFWKKFWKSVPPPKKNPGYVHDTGVIFTFEAIHQIFFLCDTPIPNCRQKCRTQPNIPHLLSILSTNLH